MESGGPRTQQFECSLFKKEAKKGCGEPLTPPLVVGVLNQVLKSVMSLEMNLVLNLLEYLELDLSD